MKDFQKNLFEIYPKLQKHAIHVSMKYKFGSAGDLLHDTMERALKKEHLFDGVNLAAWLKTIMKNIALDEYRKGLKHESTGEERKNLEAIGQKTSSRKAREVSYEGEKKHDESDNESEARSDSEFNPASLPSQGMASILDPKDEQEASETNQDIKKLYAAIKKMGQKCQDIFHQYMQEEGSFLELSKRMGMPLGTVQSRFHRCKEKLLIILLKEVAGEGNAI
jgi:RNA polymerase sigma-70 factor (ECF subfamily)